VPGESPAVPGPSAAVSGPGAGMTGPQGLHRVPARIEPYLAAAGRGAARGAVVLALDGLACHVAVQALAHASVTPLRSTFPSTSTTAWMTSVTGVEAADHGVVGAVYRSPGSDRVTDLLSGRSRGYAGRPRPAGPETGPGPQQPLLLAVPTVFDRARELGVRAVAVGRELAGLTGPWREALLHGAVLYPGPASSDPASIHPTSIHPASIHPAAVVERTVRDVDAVLDPPRDAPGADTPVLVWAHVNLDDHIHRAGYDAALLHALRTLDEAADRWAEAGWGVLGHADHGLVPVRPRPDLAQLWERFDRPERCQAPGGGAGRVRWLYPLPGLERRLADDLRAAFDGHAVVLSPDELAEQGLMTVSPAVRERIGQVVAIAASPQFPVPDLALTHEHGAATQDEVLVPFAVWGEPTAPLPASP
jgi:Type I phosphodiesterase / nucleotide pyrophosphatase